MTSLKENSDVTDAGNVEEEKSSKVERKEPKELAELPPSGTSLHKRRRGEPPASLSVRSPQNSDPEGSSPCTAGPSPPEEYWSPNDVELADPETICETMLQRLRDQNDAISKRGKEVAEKTKDTIEALDQLEKLLELLDQLVTLKEHNTRLLKRLKDVNHLKRLHSAHKRIDSENEKLRSESKELELINEALDAEFESEYGQLLFGSVMGNRSMKRSGSKWKGNARFGGSLLRKQRSRSAGGDDSDVAPGTPLRRRSEGIFMKEVEKSKVSKWTRVKAAFRWEKAQWPQSAMGGAAGAVAAGAMVGAVALAGSSPSSATLANPEPRDSASLTPGSALSLTPNSSCEELRVDSGMRKSVREDGDNTFLQAPTQDDSSTSPSPNKLHKTTWSKMKDIIQQTRKESVKKKTTSTSNRGSKSSPDVVPKRRRSLSDGGDSDAPPALTLTIPSSEELGLCLPGQRLNWDSAQTTVIREPGLCLPGQRLNWDSAQTTVIREPGLCLPGQRLNWDSAQTTVIREPGLCLPGQRLNWDSAQTTVIREPGLCLPGQRLSCNSDHAATGIHSCCNLTLRVPCLPGPLELADT
ncbi:uncharacterized protein LOC111357253 [Spodoptera litura]|uniref:Uncharacterized protein LOC111357253 n=1 Tax=Spodoptera litura TaxID=69820 RepID=A0A9J7EB83_SPOLT|nr:uncharacterized protein LOC111357253 [Spodoptera litura]